MNRKSTKNKGSLLIFTVLFVIVSFLILPADFTVKAEIGGFDASNVWVDVDGGANELPDIRDGAPARSFFIYAYPDVSAECKNTLALLLAETPTALLPPYLDIELHSAPPTEFHGLTDGRAIKLNCALQGPRLREVFYHELGHVMYEMLPVEQKAIFEKRAVTYAANGAPNYLTEYAMTNPYEDFADSFMIYMTRKKVFREKAEKSPVLRAKYESINSHFETFVR